VLNVQLPAQRRDGARFDGRFRSQSMINCCGDNPAFWRGLARFGR
jgi:hypothetical protein